MTPAGLVGKGHMCSTLASGVMIKVLLVALLAFTTRLCRAAVNLRISHSVSANVTNSVCNMSSQHVSPCTLQPSDVVCLCVCQSQCQNEVARGHRCCTVP